MKTIGQLVAERKKQKRKPSTRLRDNSLFFIEYELKKMGIEVVKEHRFDAVRRWRFDMCVLSLKIAIEYEGIGSSKSRHTTLTGYTGDCEKYNAATKQGWKVLRYSALNIKDALSDLKEIINQLQEK